MARILKVDDRFDHHYFKGTSCAFGVFDGVHRGHQFLLTCAQQSAHDSGGESVALTFDIDPDEMFHPGRLRKLMTNEDRISSLAAQGVDAVVVLPFTKEFSALEPFEFLEKTFNGFAPESVHIGANFRFGAKALGTVKELHDWGKNRGTRVCAHELESFAGQPITSTGIRLLLAERKIKQANELLGYSYYLQGQVRAGRGEGADFGFRTANLSLDATMQALGEGVYAAFVEVAGKKYKAAVSVGVSPTFEGETTATCEAHILDFEGDLYGERIKIEFVEFLRPLIKFESTEELIETVQSNIEWVRKNLQAV